MPGISQDGYRSRPGSGRQRGGWEDGAAGDGQQQASARRRTPAALRKAPAANAAPSRHDDGRRFASQSHSCREEGRDQPGGGEGPVSGSVLQAAITMQAGECTIALAIDTPRGHGGPGAGPIATCAPGIAAPGCAQALQILLGEAVLGAGGWGKRCCRGLAGRCCAAGRVGIGQVQNGRSGLILDASLFGYCFALNWKRGFFTSWSPKADSKWQPVRHKA